MRKQVFRASDQVEHKLACTVSEKKLEISDLERRGIILSVLRCSENKGDSCRHGVIIISNLIISNRLQIF